MKGKITTGASGAISKEQLLAHQRQVEKVNRAKAMARDVFPHLTGLKTVFDAQTAVNAASGHILYGIQTEEKKLNVSNLTYDLGKGKTDVDTAVTAILETVKGSSAREAHELLESMGRNFERYLAQKHLKDPMDIKVDEFIA